MKNSKTIFSNVFLTLLGFGLLISTTSSLYGQSENRYFDGETIGAKGTVDRKKLHFISTGATKVSCPDSGTSAGVFYAYVLETDLIGNMISTATLIGDGVNDYFGKDIKTIDSGVYYITGYTTKGQTYPGVFIPNQNSITRYYNAFISLVDFNQPSNNWIRVFGDPVNNDQGLAIVIDNSGNACITGISNERLPCMGGSDSTGCDSACYPTSEVLFAIFSSSGTQIRNNSLNLGLSQWGVGNDIVFDFNKLYIAATVSNSTCISGYKSNAEVISFDLITNLFSAKKLQNDSGLSYTGSGLVNDQGVFVMVGEVVNASKGYTWGFDQMLNPMFFDHFTDNNGKWGFKDIVVDSICTFDTIHLPDTLIMVPGYKKNYVISGEEWSNIRIYSNMMALNVDPGLLPAPIVGVNFPYRKYMFENSVNANIVFPPVSCMSDRTQVVDLGIFGHSYDNNISNHSAYITAVTSSLNTGCDELYDYKLNARYFMDSIDFVDSTDLLILDSIFNSVIGINRDPICEIVFRAPPMNQNTGNSLFKANTMNSKSNLRVFPNPTQSTINIQSDLSLLNKSVELFDYSGQLVKSTINHVDTKLVRINTTELHDGIYFLRVKDENYTFVAKVVIKK